MCADEPEYDGLDFQGYPSRRGWSTSSDPYEWLYCLPGAAAVRAQGWLFFGLLSVFLGPRFRRYDYVKLSQGSDTWVLDTSALPRCLSDTVHSAKKGTLASELSMPNLNAVGELWDNAFLKVKAESEALRAYLNRTLDLKLMLVELPISTLLVSLQRMADRLFWRDDVVPIMCSVELKSATFSGWQMMESKWCENQVQHFYDVYSPFLNHYLSGLPRRSASGDHENCKRDSCVGYNVNEETYEPQHVDDGCYCQYLGPDIRQVTDLLRAGRIPLIRMSVQAGSPVLDVLAADRDTQYISVSHLWSGGLGNFKDNKLPLCQLLKLYELLNNIERFQPQDPFYQMFPRGTLRTISSIPWLIDWRLAQFTTIARQNYRRLLSAEEEGQDSAGLRPIYFWMDTLCIPVSPRYHDLRMKAIGNMALTYAAATKCLVIDPELRRISMKGLTMTQLNAHVLCSGWVRRSWTFQEAKLSRVWYVQFADGLYNPNSVENNELEYRLYSARNTDRSDAHALASEAICWYHDMPPARLVNVYLNQIQWEEFHDPPYRFQAIWNEMVSRSTSKPEDVHGILANLLDLSATEVLTLPLEDRMKAILGEQETLSTGLVYSNGPKVQDQANRWVPVFPSSRYLSPLYGQMKRVSDGYLLDKEKANPVGFIVDKSTPRYSTLRIFDSSSTAGPLWINLASERDGPPVEFKVSGEVLAVIYVVGDLKKSTEHGRRLQGARFGLRRKEEKTLHLVYEYSFAYGHRIRDPFYDRVDEYPIVDAERTPEDTIFQIDCGA